MKDLHLMSEANLLEQIASRAALAQRPLMGSDDWPREIAALTAELQRRRSAELSHDQELEHRWGNRDADIFRLDEFGNIVHLRGEHGRRYWTYPEGYDRAYLAAITLALAITAGYQPGAPG